ncbi:hypothetical protein VFPPC_14798 [Pochonia chlamydosporia 170]|uniref:Uncharacterized protein n=1 Tax=Pochonia chlamydosporia 170 TaxID=1380566 RepID=A0A179F4A1_METCM|nr:hypothetical protein VFPPC_14798 [Pochonia chlamydosporia 170]OAQ60200.1 hypothetical protein VFPPC_14798 [Pochonia chlamydosporia 170]
MSGTSELRLSSQTTTALFGSEIKQEDEAHPQWFKDKPTTTTATADIVVNLYQEAWDACLEWQGRFQQLCETNTIALRAYEADIVCAIDQIDCLRHEKANMQDQMQSKDTEISNLIKSLSHTFAAKERIFEECEKQRFQREFGDLILSQYREEIVEHKAAAKEKDRIIEELVELIATIESELGDLRAKPNWVDVKGVGVDTRGTNEYRKSQLGSGDHMGKTSTAQGRRGRRRQHNGSKIH